MKKYSYEEFIRFDRSFTVKKKDFYGENSPLDFISQKEFLKEYAEYHKKKYGENVFFEKAISDEEAKVIAKGLLPVSERTFSASKKKLKSEYKHWRLYTARAKISEGKVILDEDGKWPMPCAKLELSGFKVKEFAFRVKISERFRLPLKEGILATTTGRYVEFRCGCEEVVKLYFSPNGLFCYKNGSEEPYHYELTQIGSYEFDEWNEIALVFEKNEFSIRYQGKSYSMGYSSVKPIDNVFLSGGMQPVDGWEFQPIVCKDENGDSLDMFEKDENGGDGEEIALGEAALPYVLGTEKNADEALILKRTFSAKKGRRYTLNVGALDPGGKILVNGKTVAEKDDFSPFRLELTEYVREGDNRLEIVVYPRAPEVLYAWHKHNDYYNGWFCLSAEIEESKEIVCPKIEIQTKSVGEKSDFSVSFKSEPFDKPLGYKLWIKKIFPQEETERLLDEGALSGEKFEKNYSRAAEPWTVETPNLYNLRLEIFDGKELLAESNAETGFRTVEQKNGGIYLNGEKILLKGALNMQFLPPYEEVPLNHVCPQEYQIVQQALAIKRMNGNCMRMHQLGYGCNDGRFASICDRLGIMLIWTTRLIDSLENVQWTGEWAQAETYKKQIAYVKNHPSIIMWEGSNELHISDLATLDRAYDGFVKAVKEEDDSRILCPVSHLYYGGGIYDYGCKYYNTFGSYDEKGNPQNSSFGWKEKDVVRSAHTYSILLGYGSSWSDMVNQNWKWQNELFKEEQKAYIISEYAVIGRQNPDTEEAKAFINKNSYELGDEFASFGENFEEEEWELSQAHQALAAALTTRQLLKCGADGMFWCSLWGGANNASYLKPVLDFYGYKKLAYYQLKEAFADMIAFNAEPEVLYGPSGVIKPIISGTKAGERYALKIVILDKDGTVVAEKVFEAVRAEADRTAFSKWQPRFPKDGYYVIRYEAEEL
ncbi:MAG: hypothetical protein IJ506_03745 [Clostridia bacterium]|nr:hypothetical protein [Clostridia bacterium]